MDPEAEISVVCETIETLEFHRSLIFDSIPGGWRGRNDLAVASETVDQMGGVKNVTDIVCIDLFCGAGGLTHGLKRSGLDVVAGVDVDDKCKHPFEVNNDAEFIRKDVAELASEDLCRLYGPAGIRVLAGCAPCQPFSTYSQRYQTVGTPKWGLLYDFARLIRKVKPEVIAMENVPAVTRHEVYGDFVQTLENTGYHVWSDMVDCRDHGLPQSRRRTVLLASLVHPIVLTAPTIEEQRTVRDAIGHMPRISNGQVHEMDRLHVAASLSEMNLRRVRASRPGGTWRDWPEHLIAPCHRKKTGRTYPGVYGRMEWDQPSPTLTTQFFGFGNGRFGHPEQDRAISLREGAILQGFPSDYSFLDDDDQVHFSALGRLIGNAVPVTLGETIGRTILHALGLEAGTTNPNSSNDYEDQKQSHTLVA